MGKKTSAVLSIALCIMMGFSFALYIQGPSLLDHGARPQILQPAWGLTSPSSFMTFTGYLYSPSTGNPITSSQAVDFAFYSNTGSAACPTGGGTLEYNETQTVGPNTQGLFNALIGSGTIGSPAGNQTTWAGMNFSSSLCLAIRVGSSGSYESPRITLTAAPYILGKITWGTQILAFPAGCSGGQAVATIAATPTCIAVPAGTIASTSTATSCAALSGLNSESVSASSTSLNAAFGCSADPIMVSTSCGANSYGYQFATTTASCSGLPFIQVGPLTTTQIMSTSVLTTINGLVTPTIAVSTSYAIYGYIPYQTSATSTSFDWAWTYTGTAPTCSFNSVQYLTQTLGIDFQESATSTTQTISTVSGSTSTVGIIINGFCTGAAGGTSTVQFLMKSSVTADTVTVETGAYLQVSVLNA